MSCTLVGSVATEAKRTSFKRGVFQPRLVCTQAMVYECGPKCECKWGEDCIQSVTQQVSWSFGEWLGGGEYLFSTVNKLCQSVGA